MKIPEKMGNEESMLVAAIIVAERNAAIANGKLYIAINQYGSWSRTDAGSYPALDESVTHNCYQS